MAFNSSNIWSWYQRRPTWLKILLFVFIIALILFAAFGTFLMTGRIFGDSTNRGPDPLQTGKDATEEHFWGKYNEARKQDNKLTTELAVEKAERDRLGKEREDAAAENKNVHAAIDAADSIADVDAALRGRRRR